MSHQSSQILTQNQEAGNASDASEGPSRRSSRVTTPMRQAGMIRPSPDSCRSMVALTVDQQRTSAVSTNQPQKRKDHPSDSLSVDESTPLAGKKPRKKPLKNSQSELNRLASKCSSSQVVDYAQDSDQENEKIKPKRQKKRTDFDDPREFFSEPFRRPDDVCFFFQNIRQLF
jgi:hypothetical protein